MKNMLEHANLVVAAWDGELMVGIAHALTDSACVGYLGDLAVRTSPQRRGIGNELIRQTRASISPVAMLVLLAAPKAVEYYPKIGFTRHGSAWAMNVIDPLPDAD
jgi:predicted N-acetyltransferase YhbS